MTRNYLVLSTGELKALLRFARTKSPEPSDTACVVLTFDIYADEPLHGQAHDVLVRTPSGPDHRLNHSTMTHHPVLT